MALRLSLSGPLDAARSTYCSSSGRQRRADAAADRRRRPARRAPLHRRSGVPRRRHADEQHGRRASRYASRDAAASGASPTSGPSPPPRGADLGAASDAGTFGRRPRPRRAGSRRRSDGSPAPPVVTRRSPRRCRPRCGRRPGATSSPSVDRRSDRRLATRLGARPRPAHVRPAGPLPSAPLRAPALRRAPRDVARRLDGHRRRRRARALLGQCWRPCATRSGDRRRSARRESAAATTRAPTSSTCSAAAPPASSYRVRRTMGQHFLQHLRRLLGEDLDAVGFFARVRQLTSNLPNRVGLAGAVGLDSFVYEDASRPSAWRSRRDADGTVVPRRAARRRSGQPRRTVAGPRAAAARAARHALLREYAEAAARCSPARGDRRRAARRRRARRPRAAPAPAPTATWTWQRTQPLPGGTGGATGRRPPGRPRRLRRRRGAVARRAPLGAERARRRRSGHARAAPPGDARRHVLPARRVGHVARHPAPRRAARRPADRAAGRRLRLGRAPAPRRPAAPVTDLPDEPGPLLAAADDPGFIHAPSLDQASAAALLRNAHLAHGGATRQPVRHQADLGPGAARRAPLRRRTPGQPLGALLGYTFERNCTRRRSTI